MSEPRSDSIARNTWFAFVISMMSAAFTAVLTLFLVRELGPEEYGVFALALGIGSLVLIPSDFGISQAGARFLAEARHDRKAVGGVVSDAIRLKIAISGFFCLLLGALAGPVANAYDTPDLAWPIRILAFGILGQSMLQLYDQLLEADRRVAVYLRIAAAESVTETVASIGLVLAGLGAAGAMAGRSGAYIFAAGIGLVVLYRTLDMRMPVKAGGTGGNIRRIASYASAFLIIDGAFTLFTQIDVLLIGAIISVTAVGQFQAPMRLMAFLSYAGTAVASGVGPRLARGVEGPDTASFAAALRRLMALQGIFVAPLVVWADPLVRITLGSEYDASADVLRALAPYAFLHAISPVLARGVNYLGEARLRIPVAIACVLVNLVFDLIFLSQWGIVAGAVGTDIAYTIYVAAHLWIIQRMLHIPLRPLAVTLGRTVVAMVAMGGVLFAFGTEADLGIPLVLAGGVAGSLAYVAALLATGEITRADLARGREVVASRFSRGG